MAEKNVKYVIVKDAVIPFSQIVSDCKQTLCFPLKQGDNLNVAFTKICEELRKTKALINSKNEEIQNKLFTTDRDFEIIGVKDGDNSLFTLRHEYIPGSTMVYVNGLRLTRDENYDYIETQNKRIQFTIPPEPGDIILVDYIRK